MGTVPVSEDSRGHFPARVVRRFRRWLDWRALRDEAQSLRDEAVDALGRMEELQSEKAA